MTIFQILLVNIYVNNLYEYRKLGWNEDVINDYKEKYFLNYVKNKPAESSQVML